MAVAPRTARHGYTSQRSPPDPWRQEPSRRRRQPKRHDDQRGPPPPTSRRSLIEPAARLGGRPAQLAEGEHAAGRHRAEQELLLQVEHQMRDGGELHRAEEQAGDAEDPDVAALQELQGLAPVGAGGLPGPGPPPRPGRPDRPPPSGSRAGHRRRPSEAPERRLGRGRAKKQAAQITSATRPTKRKQYCQPRANAMAGSVDAADHSADVDRGLVDADRRRPLTGREPQHDGAHGRRVDEATAEAGEHRRPKSIAYE